MQQLIWVHTVYSTGQSQYLELLLCFFFCFFFQVWPVGKVVFPDFFKDSVHELWKRLIVKHHKTLPFDALWIVCNPMIEYFFPVCSLKFCAIQIKIRQKVSARIMECCIAIENPVIYM